MYGCVYLVFFSVERMSLERKCISSQYFTSWHLSAIHSWWHIPESMTPCKTIYHERKNQYSNISSCIFTIIKCILSSLFCRRLLVEKCTSSNFSRRVGKQEFVIPLKVLDLVYSQTVTWVGVFYCPLLPAISIFKLLAIFYISKVCLYSLLISKHA